MAPGARFDDEDQLYEVFRRHLKSATSLTYPVSKDINKVSMDTGKLVESKALLLALFEKTSSGCLDITAVRNSLERHSIPLLSAILLHSHVLFLFLDNTL